MENKKVRQQTKRVMGRTTGWKYSVNYTTVESLRNKIGPLLQLIRRDRPQKQIIILNESPKKIISNKMQYKNLELYRWRWYSAVPFFARRIFRRGGEGKTGMFGGALRGPWSHWIGGPQTGWGPLSISVYGQTWPPIAATRKCAYLSRCSVDSRSIPKTTTAAALQRAACRLIPIKVSGNHFAQLNGKLRGIFESIKTGQLLVLFIKAGRERIFIDPQIYSPQPNFAMQKRILEDRPRCLLRNKDREIQNGASRQQIKLRIEREITFFFPAAVVARLPSIFLVLWAYVFLFF